MMCDWIEGFFLRYSLFVYILFNLFNLLEKMLIHLENWRSRYFFGNSRKFVNENFIDSVIFMLGTDESSTIISNMF